jgi:predicted transposase YbfD/YdcC
LLTIALTASVCGAESCVDFADFARDRETLFRSFLSLSGGLPSHDTFSRLFRLLDPAAFARCFAQFIDHLGERGRGVLAIDGKTLRATFDAASGGQPLHVVTAFATDCRMVLGQIAATSGNEIAAAREVLQAFDIQGMLVTGDALHCQVETAQLVLDRQADYLFPVKLNRRALLRDLEAFFADPKTSTEDVTHTDADHGRIETRRHRVSHDVAWLFGQKRYPEDLKLPGITTLAMVESEVERGGQITRKQRYYISSAHLSAEAFAGAARAHWGIENRLHWVLDTCFNEDRARSRRDHAGENLAILRKLTLNLLQSAHPKISIRRKRKRSGWSDEFARSVLGQMR